MATYVGAHVLVGRKAGAEALADLQRSVRKHFDLFTGEAILGSDPGSEWIEVRLFDDEGCPRLGRALSSDLSTDVVCFVTESTVDAFSYWRFSKGEETRCLVYGMTEERVW